MKISVIIPTTNRVAELEHSISEYLKQTYTDFEILVMDNASSDGTGEVVKKFIEMDNRIKYYRFEENLYFTAFNYGVWQCSGDIVWVCDDDSNPKETDTFQNIVNIFTKFPNISIIGCEDIEVNSNNSIWQWHPIEVDKVNVPEDGYKTFLFHGTGAGIRKEVFNKIGGFWGFGMEELDFTTRAILNGFEARYFPNIHILHFSSQKVRNREERWIHMSSQVIKYYFKYFGFWSAFWKSHIMIFIELLRAIYFRFSPAIILHAILSWQYTAINTYRREHTPIPKDRIYDVTFGISPIKSQFRYIKFMILKRVKRKS
jgi:glycosyltransferase involved in cell wall biosynthesis